jgi:DNA-binding MarR family transcriptional regulator
MQSDPVLDIYDKLEQLLEEIKLTAPAGDDPAEAVIQLLNAAGEMTALAESIAEGAEVIEGNFACMAAPASDGAEFLVGAIQQEAAYKRYDARRVRDRVFADPTLFGEASWDILLDLLASEKPGRRVSISSASVASGVPPTTALRWISVLESRGLIKREDDHVDRRRTFLKLTDKAHALFDSYFVELGRRNLI